MMLIVKMVPVMMTMIVGMVTKIMDDDDDDLCEHARHDGEAGYFHIL